MNNFDATKSVTPAKAGAYTHHRVLVVRQHLSFTCSFQSVWAPAFAGVTQSMSFTRLHWIKGPYQIIAQIRHIIHTAPDSAGASPQTCCQWEVIHITESSSLLIIAIVTAMIAFATLVLKIVEVSRKK